MPNPTLHPSFCQECGRRRRPREFSCPDCGESLYGPHVLGHVKPARAPAPLGGILSSLELPIGNVALIYGVRGTGKTSIGMAALRKPWIASSEMDGQLLAEYRDRLGLSFAGVSVPRRLEVPDAHGRTVDLGLPVDLEADLLVDSLTATGDDVGALAAAMAYAQSGRRVIVTAQVTKEGGPRGPATIEHDPDLVIELDTDEDRGIARVKKNRAGPLSTLVFQLGRDGATALAWNRYYSIEGKGGAYRLEPWPSRSARFAELLRAAEAGQLGEGLELPPPPLAVACERSSLYRGGWIEPADIARRKQFAADNGIPYWFPGDPPP